MTTASRYRYVTLKETAQHLRAALKKSHPGVKFSVRGDAYAGGASIRVRWTDGPTQRDVEKTAKQFAGATFDGMTDMKDYVTSTFQGEKVHWGADFVFAERDESDALIARVTAGIPEQPDGRDDRQCQTCGGWPKGEDRWMALSIKWDSRMTCFACSRECAGRYSARHVAA